MNSLIHMENFYGGKLFFLNLLNKYNSFQVIKGLMPSILTIHIALKVLVVLIRDLTRINLCPIVRMYLGMA